MQPYNEGVETTYRRAMMEKHLIYQLNQRLIALEVNIGQTLALAHTTANSMGNDTLDIEWVHGDLRVARRLIEGVANYVDKLYMELDQVEEIQDKEGEY